MGHRRQPNIIFIVMDDMGYGDMECYGRTAMRTPAMNRIAEEGMAFTRMYTAPICSPARAQILTGCYAQRVGIPRVLFPQDEIGLTPEFPTVAAHLRGQGYATMAIGKWHLGCRPAHFPTRHGFDRYYGLLYSNDMAPLHLYRNETIEEETVEQAALTRRYSEEALSFIEEHRDRPFFCYLAHTMPHVPLHAEEPFLGHSACGLYGDTIECIDHYIGRILEKLDALSLAEDTLVIVTSDNGPWYEGHTAGLRGRKFEVHEGGVKVPFIARWPGVIPAGTTCTELAHLIDMLPTFVSMAGGEAPAGIDGLDITRLFTGTAPSPHDFLYLYHQEELLAVVKDTWKLHVKQQRGEYWRASEFPQLFDLSLDASESYNLASRHPELVAALQAQMQTFDAEMKGGAVELAQ